MTNLKKFLLFSIGLAVGFIFAAIFYTSYYYGATSDRETMRFLNTLMNVTDSLKNTETKLIGNEKIESIYSNRFAGDSNVSRFYQSSSGDVLLMTSAQQIAWLKPTRQDTKIVWLCYAAPKESTLMSCANFRSR